MNQTESPSLELFPLGLEHVSNDDTDNSRQGLKNIAAVQQCQRSSASSEVDKKVLRCELIVSVSDHDIISTRGQPKHLGTIRYRELILENKFVFDDSHCAKIKRALVLNIIDALAPGRFLRLYKTDGGKDTYELMDPQTVYKKVTNAMKDCRSEANHIYRSLQKIDVEKKQLITSIRKKTICLQTKRQDDTVRKKKRKGNYDVLEMKIHRQNDINRFLKNLESIEPMSDNYLYTNDKQLEPHTNVSGKKCKAFRRMIFPETLSSEEDQLLTEFDRRWNNFECVYKQQSEIDMSGLRSIFESNC